MIRKSLRKSSFIFGDPRVSLYVSSLTADHYFWCSRVFLAVLRVFRGIMGCSGVFRWCSGVFRGCSGGVPGCSGCVPGVFRGVPGVFRGVPRCSGCVPGCSGVFRVLQTPLLKKLAGYKYSGPVRKQSKRITTNRREP